MKTKTKKRVMAAVLALCVLAVSPLNVFARTVEEIENEQAQLEEEKQALEAKLETLRNDEAEKQAYQQALQEKIDIVQGKIDAARRDISDLDSQITALTMKLEKSQQEIQSTYDQFKERLVTLYRAGDVSTLEILLTSDSFSDFTMRSELIKAMTVHDQQLLQKIEDYMDRTQGDRDACEADKRKVAELKKQLESDQKELDALYAENAAAIAELQNAQDATNQAIAENEAQGAALIAEVEELIRKQKEEEERRKQEAVANGWGDGSFDYPIGGGGVEGFNPIWPLPGVSYVSCYYGGYAGHRGMDIAGPYGTPVVAAESGIVIDANDYDSWGMSWGYYVLVYHNGTFTTRYAHLSGLTVSNGQYVEQGQVIGYEGATGNVTGPHLHFEVYENQSRVDPMIYL